MASSRPSGAPVSYLLQRLQSERANLRAQASAALSAICKARGALRSCHCPEAENALAAAEELVQGLAGEEEVLGEPEEELRSLRATLETVREALRCPVSHDFFRDPVIASDGRTYDRGSIEPWLRRQPTSPITRERLEERLYPNHLASVLLKHLVDQLGDSVAEDVTVSSSMSPMQDAETGTLLAAIKKEDTQRALAILRCSEIPGLNDQEQNGATVLHYATSQNMPEVALSILARSDFRSVNAKDAWGCTALHHAAFWGSLEVCERIVDREDFLELLAQDPRPWGQQTAQACAARRGHLEVANFLKAAEGLRAVP